MVCHALAICHHIGENKAHFNGAYAGAQALHMARLQLFAQAVYHRLQRLYGAGRFFLPRAEGRDGQVQNARHGAGVHIQLGPALRREGKALFVQLFGRICHVYGVVANALKIAQAMQVQRHLAALFGRELAAAQLHKVGAQGVFIAVHLCLQPGHLRGPFFIILAQKPNCKAQRLFGAGRHIACGHTALFQRNAGALQKALVQAHGRARALWRGIRFGLLGRHGKAGQLFQHLREGQQHQRGKHIEHAVHHRNACGTYRLAQEGEANQGVQAIEHRHENGRANDVEIKVHQRRALGIALRAHAGQQRRNTGANVLAHDDGHSGAPADGARGRQRLQNAHAGRGRLNDGREHGAGRKAQQRVLEHGEQPHKGGVAGKRLYGRTHGFHAEHQHGKAQQHLRPIALFFFFRKQDDDHAHRRQHRGEGAGL